MTGARIVGRRFQPVRDTSATQSKRRKEEPGKAEQSTVASRMALQSCNRTDARGELASPPLLCSLLCSDECGKRASLGVPSNNPIDRLRTSAALFGESYLKILPSYYVQVSTKTTLNPRVRCNSEGTMWKLYNTAL